MAKSNSPLGGDTISPLNAPPVRMGLQAKLNLLIGLIVATALGVAAFLIYQQIHDETTRLRSQGLALGAMLAQVADEALSSGDMSNVVAILDGLSPDLDIAYVAVLDAQRQPRIKRSYSDAALPASAGALPDAGRTSASEPAVANGRQLDLYVPVYSP